MTCDSKNSNKQTPCIVFPVGVFDLGFTISNLVSETARYVSCPRGDSQILSIWIPLLPVGHYNLTYPTIYHSTFIEIDYFIKGTCQRKDWHSQNRS